MNSVHSIISNIINPSDEFTPIPFWFYNDYFDEKKIFDNLKDFVSKGVNAFVLHPRIGIPNEVEYLSKEYFRQIKYIVKVATSLNMKVVLYDEGMYPSGSACGQVVRLHPEFRSKGIRIVSEVEYNQIQQSDSYASIVSKLDDGSLLIYASTFGTIRGIHYGEDDHELNAPMSADILNPDAVDLFINLTHDKYYENLKEYFSSTIIGFFTDEPSPTGRNAGKYKPWISGLEKEIIENGGNLNELRPIFEKNNKETNKTIDIFHSLIKKGLRDIFYKRLATWCKNHSISLMGHPAESDDIEEEIYFDIPGQDLIQRRVSPEEGGISQKESVLAKLGADIAKALNKRRNSNECFGVCYKNNIPWYMTGYDMKWFINWLGVRGVNMFIPHAFYYSVREKRSEERPPDVGPNNIWWNHYQVFSSYMKRLSYLMTDSYNDARIAVLCDNNNVPYQEVKYFYENNIEFNYLPVNMLKNANYINNQIVLNNNKYDVLLNCLGDKYNSRLKEYKDILVDYNESSLNQFDSFKAITGFNNTKDLRYSSINKDGVKMHLFVNEGSEVIEGMPNITSNSLMINLFTKDTYGFDGKIKLYPADCILLVEGISSEKKFVCYNYLDITNEFEYVLGNDSYKMYQLDIESDEENIKYIAINAQEMVEIYNNDEFIDVSFYSIHRFKMPIHKGNNHIEIKVYGNIANKYGSKIEYGIIK